MREKETRLELPVELADRIRRELVELHNAPPSALLLEDQKISAAFSVAVEYLCKEGHEVLKDKVHKFIDEQTRAMAAAIAEKLKELGEAALKEKLDVSSEGLAKEVIGELEKEAGQLDKESVRARVLSEIRKSLRPQAEAATKTGSEGVVAGRIETAIEILGQKNVFGPKEVEKTFGVRLKKVPEIPFSAEELDRAANMGQMLVLRVDKTADGKPMSLMAMNDIIAKRWERENKGGLLYTAEGWKNWIGEDRFAQESPRTGWALVSRDVLPESLSKNYIEQTEVIIATLRDEAFKGMDVPREYAEAIAEFESKKDRLVRLVNEDWKKAAKEFSELKITKMTRQTFSEAIYDLAAYHDANNERLFRDKNIWSASLHPNGDLVSLGRFGGEGVVGGGWGSLARNGDLGVSLSRRL